MFRGAALFFLLYFCVASLHAQEWNRRYENHMLWAREAFDPEQVQILLQDFVNNTKGKAYRYFADKEDFFHGHLLYADARSEQKPERLKLLGVLYHTQEEAAKHNEKDPGGKYDYLNRHARSWVQFASSDRALRGPIVNALELMFDFFPDTEDYRSGLEATRSRYTVYADQLDYRKFPSTHKQRPLGSVQFDFDPCDSDAAKLTRQMMWLDGGQIKVREADAEQEVCLQLRMSVSYSPEDFFDENSESLPLKNDARPDVLVPSRDAFLALETSSVNR